jgi:sarcosine oxidase subunit alpha
MRVERRINGGLINRRKPVWFSFNGQTMTGRGGDTLASALLANGIHMVGRSFKYHRPRGIFSSGVEEPNALVTIGSEADQDPNVRATVAELHDGLEAFSQNHVGSLEFDLMAVNDLIAPFLGAGFYYKTFMWPAALWEKLYEPMIRRSAGLGALSGESDPSRYDKGYRHCDLLVIGSGAAGLTAALAAGRAGLDVILAEQDFIFGGRLNAETDVIGRKPSAEWAAETVAELAAMKNVRMMPRTTVAGAYDHGVYGALERVTDHLDNPGDKPRQILWRIYTKRAILASGSIERPIAFGHNDRPGIMLAGAVREYANRYAVAAGSNITILTNNNDGWRTAYDLNEAGVHVAAIIDTREEPPFTPPEGTRLIADAGVVDTSGKERVESITLTTGEELETDCLAVSGGWSPSVHLTCHHRGRPVWDDQIAGFVPAGGLPPGMIVAGATNGRMQISEVFADGVSAARTVVKDLGGKVTTSPPKAKDWPFAIEPCWYIPSGRARAWVDFQNDVTAKDVKQAHLEGFRSVEHLKRYTTMGMATDQGKTSNIPGLAIMAEISGKSMDEVGTTIFRPPYTPIPIGAFAGRSRGLCFRPTRKTPTHAWAAEQGAVFVDSGLWKRAQWYPRPGETHWRQSVDREVTSTRSSVGICDVSTLGKIDIKGDDAREFINRVYSNGFAKLAPGKVRYGVMLRDDGFVMDDGTTACVADDHFIMTTTTANAGPVYRHLEFCRQCLWPKLDVALISTTDQVAQYAVAGPNSRRLLEKIVDPGTDISNEAFPYMGTTGLKICGGINARLFRISFSGELAYELSVPARYGDSLVRVLMEAGAEFDVTPYGTEALNVMRIEKGHPTGNELTGQTSAHHLGMEKLLSPSKDFIGRAMAWREELIRPDGIRLVGFKALDPKAMLDAGAHFLDFGAPNRASHDLGWMSSTAFSPILGTSIGLGFIREGHDRMGDVVRAVDLVRGQDIEVEVTSPHFIDPEGRRLRD